jgi:hypothetical protein
MNAANPHLFIVLCLAIGYILWNLRGSGFAFHGCPHCGKTIMGEELYQNHLMKHVMGQPVLGS